MCYQAVDWNKTSKMGSQPGDLQMVSFNLLGLTYSLCHHRG